jgi:SAM-dependent methyltransferase
METEVPIPPVALSARLSQAPAGVADAQGYLERGRRAIGAIERVLPADWTWTNKRVLDFGCGAGRAVRHLHDAARTGEVWGCDIDPACTAWNREHLDPSMSFVVNGEEPPLPFAEDRFDLVYALSVFTHIDQRWASWLIEMHRVLVPGGLLVATIMSEGMCAAVSGEPWDESRVGMNVYECGQAWALGGPMVLHSPWWIREHWGRLFDVVDVRSRGLFEQSDSQMDDHGVAVLRKAGRSVSVAELERIDPSEEREVSALRHDLLHLRAEVAGLRNTPRG